MKIENLQKVNNLNEELNTNKTRLKKIENETIKLHCVELYYDYDSIFLKDDELLERVRWLTYGYIVKKNKEITEQLKELGVEVEV